MPPLKPVTSWSFSRYSDYQQCPLKFRLKHIDRIKEPKTEPLIHGSEVHSIIENYLKGNGPEKPPKELGPFKKMGKEIRARYKKRTLVTIIEDSWAFTKEWVRTKWDDWAKCWVRIKIDLGYLDGDVLYIDDWKTGKFRESDIPKYTEQLELYALAGFLIHPSAKYVVPSLRYVEAGRTYPNPDEGDDDVIFTRDMLPTLIKSWEQRARPMFKDKKFPPRPNQFCGWCHFRANNKENGGGQCRY